MALHMANISSSQRASLTKLRSAGRPAAFLMAFAVLMLLAGDRIWHAHLWAEDGTVFLPEALQLGVASIIRPHFGYCLFVQRSIAYLWVQFPLKHFAFAISVSCLTIYAWVISKFADNSYRWLVRSDWARAGFCLIACFLPGLDEVIGNLANLHAILFIYLGLLAWKDINKSFSALEIACFFVAAGSTGNVIVLMPALAYRTWYIRHKKLGAGVREAVLLFIAAGWSLMHYCAARSAEHAGLFPINFLSINTLIASTLRMILERYTVVPLLGLDFLKSVRKHDAWRVFAVGVPLALLLISSLWRRHRDKALLVALTPLCITLSYTLTWLVRVGSYEHMLKDPPFIGRYLIATAPFAVVLWLSAAERWGRARPILVSAILSTFIAVGWKHTVHGPMGDARDWPGASAKLKAALDAEDTREVVIPINPSGWKLVYRTAH